MHAQRAHTHTLLRYFLKQALKKNPQKTMLTLQIQCKRELCI